MKESVEVRDTINAINKMFTMRELFLMFILVFVKLLCKTTIFKYLKFILSI